MKPASAEERRVPTRVLFARRRRRGRVFFGHFLCRVAKKATRPTTGGTKDLNAPLRSAGEAYAQHSRETGSYAAMQLTHRLLELLSKEYRHLSGLKLFSVAQ
jgi:hypothetical protein